MKHVLHVFLKLFLATTLFFQGPAMASMFLTRSMPQASIEAGESAAPQAQDQNLVHTNCHTLQADEKQSTCSACSACCLGALLLSRFTQRSGALSGAVQQPDTPPFWQTHVAEHLDPPPRQR